MSKTLFEKSFEEWRAETGGSRREWTEACVKAWKEICDSILRKLRK
jgi:hypothetical protein